MGLEQRPVGNIQPELERCLRLAWRLAGAVEVLELAGEALDWPRARRRLPPPRRPASPAAPAAIIASSCPSGARPHRDRPGVALRSACGWSRRPGCRRPAPRTSGPRTGPASRRRSDQARPARAWPHQASRRGRARSATARPWPRHRPRCRSQLALAGFSESARQLGLAIEPALGQRRLLLVQLAAALGELLPGIGIAVIPFLLIGSRPGGWRCRRGGDRSRC